MNFLKRNWISLALAGLVALALVQIWLVRGTVMGDAFIHFVFARGIAAGDFFGYNGAFSAGSTSPLWSLLLAPVWLLFGDSIPAASQIFAGFFAGLAVVLSYFVARKITGRREPALFVAALFAGSFVLSFWVAKGMETPLAASLILGSFAVYLRLLDRPSIAGEIGLGALLGLAALTRPEGFFWAAALGLSLLIRGNFRIILTAGLPGLAILAPYYWLLFSETGQILPSSAARVLHARQFVHENFGIFWTAEVAKILATKLLPVVPFAVAGAWLALRRPKQNLLQKFQTALGMTGPDKSGWPIFGPILFWIMFHLAFFTFVMPMTQGYRYLVPMLPFLYLLAAAGIWRIANPKLRAAVAAAVLVASFGISAKQLGDAREKIATCEQPIINETRRDTGLWLRDNTEPNDLIAIKEVDQSAYYSGRRVLSMDGTLNLAAVPFVETGDQLGYLQEFKPDWLVLEEEMYNYPGWLRSNLWPLIDPALAIGESKELGGIRFELAHKIENGNRAACRHFTGDKSEAEPYFWYFYRISYSQ